MYHHEHPTMEFGFLKCRKCGGRFTADVTYRHHMCNFSAVYGQASSAHKDDNDVRPQWNLPAVPLPGGRKDDSD